MDDRPHKVALPGGGGTATLAGADYALYQQMGAVEQAVESVSGGLEDLRILLSDMHEELKTQSDLLRDLIESQP